jgi:hypothetical protein
VRVRNGFDFGDHPPSAQAQDQDAAKILKAMTDYVASQKVISAIHDMIRNIEVSKPYWPPTVGIEPVSKCKFLNNREKYRENPKIKSEITTASSLNAAFIGFFGKAHCEK